MTEGEQAGEGRCGEGRARPQALRAIRDEEVEDVSFPGSSVLSWLLVFLLPGPGRCPREKYQERETRALLSLGRGSLVAVNLSSPSP